MSPVSIQPLREKYEKPQPSSPEQQNKSIGDLHEQLKTIETLSSHFNNSPTGDIAHRIIETLNRVRNILLPLSAGALQKYFEEIRKIDGEKWKTHIWENVEFADAAYHEKNTGSTKKGIAPEQLIHASKSIGKETHEEAIKKLVIHLVAIYGLQTDTVRKVSGILSQ